MCRSAHPQCTFFQDLYFVALGCAEMNAVAPWIRCCRGERGGGTLRGIVGVVLLWEGNRPGESSTRDGPFLGGKRRAKAGGGGAGKKSQSECFQSPKKGGGGGENTWRGGLFFSTSCTGAMPWLMAKLKRYAHVFRSARYIIVRSKVETELLRCRACVHVPPRE